MERGNEWSVRVTRGIGRRVAYHRERADLTASMLSARCASLGLPLDRNVIAKLENGHRNSVTADEVLVLAAALQVPPVVLLFGVGTEETAELLPGNHAPPYAAARWFSGEAPVPGDDPRWAWGWEPLKLYRDYEQAVAGELGVLAAVAEANSRMESAGAAERASLAQAVEASRVLIRQSQERAREIREQLARGGWLPPGETPIAEGTPD